MPERVWRKGNPLTLLVGIKLVQPLWRTVWRFLKKLEIELPYDPAIPLLGIHRVRDAIQPSHPLSSPSPPAPNPAQHQSLFQ